MNMYFFPLRYIRREYTIRRHLTCEASKNILPVLHEYWYALNWFYNIKF